MQNKFKIGLIEYDTRNNNPAINKMLQYNKKYADLYNYTFIFDNFNINQVQYQWQQLIINNQNLFKLRLYYHRFQLFEKYMDDFDYLVSIDSDIIINNPTIKIEDLIDNQHDIFIGQDGGIFATSMHLLNSANIVYKYLTNNNLAYLTDPYKNLTDLKVFEIPIRKALKNISTNTDGLNCGFIIIKCSKIIKTFIEDFKKYYCLFEEQYFDQGCVATLLERKKYKNIFKKLPITTQGNPFYNHPDFIFNEDKNFLCHYYGQNSNINRLLEHIQIIKNNKWWRSIK